MADIHGVFLVVSNIPAAFHSVDLRNYFSQFIESGGFICFHYRHRPEVHRESQTCGDSEEDGDKSSGSSDLASSAARDNCSKKTKQAAKTCCCVVSVHNKHADRLVRMYAGNHWIDSKGNWLSRRCVIKRAKVSQHNGKSVLFSPQMCNDEVRSLTVRSFV